MRRCVYKNFNLDRNCRHRTFTQHVYDTDNEVCTSFSNVNLRCQMYLVMVATRRTAIRCLLI